MIGIENEYALLLVLIGFPLIYLAYKNTGYERKIAFANSILVLVLSLAIAQPYVMSDQSLEEEKVVHLLEDETPSTQLLKDVNVSNEEISVDRTVLTGSPESLTDTLIDTIDPNKQYVLDTDLQTMQTDRVVQHARENNITLHALDPDQRDASSVSIDGPDTAVKNSEFEIKVRVSTTQSNQEPTLEVGDDSVNLEEKEEDVWKTSLEFEEKGYHTLKANIDDSGYLNNTENFYKTVRVVEEPEIFVLGDSGDLEQEISDHYDLDFGDTLPEDLDEYHAVHLREDPSEIDATSLEQFVLEGGGLLHTSEVVDDLDRMLPVEESEDPQDTSAAQVIFAVDSSFMEHDCPSHPCGDDESEFDQQATGETNNEAVRVAYSLINELPGHNRVGAIGFNRREAFVLEETNQLSDNRDELMGKLERIRPQGSTGYLEGLEGAEAMVDSKDSEEGNIVLITDGTLTKANRNLGTEQKAYEIAEGFDVPLITVGVGENPNERFLQNLAERGDGHYVDASQVDSLEFKFEAGGAEEGEVPLGVSQPNHYITSDISMTSTAEGFRNVETKQPADQLITGSNGVPAVSSWNYGLGRVASVSLHNEGINQLATYDPEVIERTVGWVVGSTTSRDENLTWSESGDPTKDPVLKSNFPNENFIQVETGIYEKRLQTDSQGIHEYEDHLYAYNYHPDLQQIGMENNWRQSISLTGGEVVKPENVAEYASKTKRESIEKMDLSRLLIGLGLIIFLIQVGYRKRNGRL